MHFLEFQARTLVDRKRQVHVGASVYHDIIPANTLRDSEYLDQPARRASGDEPCADASRPPGSCRTRSTSSGPSHRCRPDPGRRCNRQAPARVLTSNRSDDRNQNRREGRAGGEARRPRKAREHVPGLRVAFPRRRARSSAARLRPGRYHFRMPARAHRLARGSRLVCRGRRGDPFGRPPPVLRPEGLHRADRRGQS